MADNTAVNSQITDSVTQVNTKVLGDAPAVAMGNLFVATSQALGLAAHNATQSQQQAGITLQASTTQGVATLYAVDTASTGLATSRILDLGAAAPAHPPVANPPASAVATGGAASPAPAPAAIPTPVNSQITDAVTQANIKVTGTAPAVAMGSLYQATSQALATAAHNATVAQQQASVTAQAAATMGIATLYSIDTAATSIATSKILSSTGQPANPQP
jgi:hypothetical protein